MSITTNKSSVCAPPLFPSVGRFPTSKLQVEENYNKQKKEENRFLLQCSESAGKKTGFTCSQSLHVSLFFDGTGNNDKNDSEKKDDKIPHPTNIAKLFHASLLAEDARLKGYFSYYMPGVGTPFPDIGEMDYSGDGLKYASGGEDRINWALLQLVHALSISLGDAPLAAEKMKTTIADMRAHWPLTGEVNRRNAFNNLLEPLRCKIDTANPKILAIKLFVYGFSRGAAEARTFVNWLSEMFTTPKGAELPEQTILGLPLSIEFLGILDTVPSVGIAHVAPFAAGHMGWADGTQQLPDEKKYPDYVKCCQHFVAAHEQRLSFPLDTIRRPNGTYPSYAKEIIYPGMHSDIGGGYPKGDQGKATGGDGELLSQIILHDMYAAAFDSGAPLSVPENLIPEGIKFKSPSFAMSSDSLIEFHVSPILVGRFNAWRETILSENETQQSGETKTAVGYKPHLLSHSLETKIEEQMGWITAWRIGRYARGSYQVQGFYTNATQWDAETQKRKKDEYDEAVSEIKQSRQTKRKDSNDSIPTTGINKQGIPEFEPTLDKQQLREAAREFEHDYYDWNREQNSVAQVILDTIPKYAIYLINSDDEQVEYDEMKKAGEGLYSKLFIDRLGSVTKDPQMALVCALYDEQIHDSRAWFMHSTLNSREPWAGYFRYRMIYSGNENNKDLSLIAVAGQVVGAATLVGGVIYTVKQKNVQNVLGGVAGTIGVMSAEYKIVDLATGLDVPLLPNAMDLLAPTKNIGALVRSQKQQAIGAQHNQRMDYLSSYLGIDEPSDVTKVA
ncbi:MAG: DUF2235 domain-containing protein [Hafnia sp.]|uniref:T6SS phospholipase effector Tle1-like catalytic domain-containing protein n=1 Tax=Hafnia sp. TaxID=1873498 RepID=UPI002FC5D13A